MGIFAAVLPRLVNTPEFRDALAARAGQALGTPVEWKSLSIGIFPPRVTLDQPVLVGLPDSTSESEASIRAEAVDLRLSLLPLLERRITVDSLVLRGVDLVATRTDDGLILPEIARNASKAGAAADAEPGEGTVSDSADSTFTLDLRELRIEDSRVVIHDRTLSPPISFHLDELDLIARGRSLGEPLDVEAAARVFANDRSLGEAKATGRVDLKGNYALDLELERVPVVELRPFLPEVDVSQGELSGRISVVVRPDVAMKASGDFDIAGLAIRLKGVDLVGDLAVRAQQKPDDKLGFEATWKSADSGKADVTGERTADGAVELTAMLDSLELAPFAPLVGSGRTIGGRATGEVSLSATADSLSRVEVDLAIASAHYADDRIDAQGKLDLALGLEEAQGGEADDQAAAKGPGAPIRIQAVFSPERGGRVDVNATGTMAGPIRAAFRFDAFDVSLLAPLLPQNTSVSGKLTGELEVDATADREIARLASRLRLGGARIVQAPVDVTGDLALDARTEESGPIDLSAKATLADGGRVALSGTSTRKGVVDLKIQLASFELASLRPFVESPDFELAGRATGSGKVVGPYSALDSLALDLAFTGASIGQGEVRVTGPFAMQLAVEKPLSAERHGRVDLDLVNAEARLGESFIKPAGVRAKLSTKFESDESGTLAFETHGPFNDINDLALRGRLGPKTTVSLTTSSFDLKGWSGLVPALATYRPEGLVAFEALSIVRSEGAKDRFGGRIALRNVDLTLPGTGRVRLKGMLDGAGERIELGSFSATLHGLTLALTGHVDDPLADARFEVAAHSVGEAEVNDLASGIANVRDTLFGALRFDARLAGVMGGEASLYDTLAGTVRFTVGESGGGRLRGISLLQATLGQIPFFGGAARLAARLQALPGMSGDPGTAVGDAPGEKFEILEGDLAIGEGRIDARTLRIRYRRHEVRLSGRMDLAGLGLDMQGELLLDPSLVAALSGRAAGDLAGRAPVRIPLAHVTNTLAEPKVSLTAATLAAAPQLLMLTTGVGAVVGDAIAKTVDGSVEAAVGSTVEKTVDKSVGQAAEKVGEVSSEVGQKVGQTVENVLGKIGRKIGGAGDESGKSRGGGAAPSSEPADPVPAAAIEVPSEPVVAVPAHPVEPAPTGAAGEGADRAEPAADPSATTPSDPPKIEASGGTASSTAEAVDGGSP